MPSQRWRVEVRRAGQWEPAWLELSEDGVAVRLGGESLSPEQVDAVYAKSLLARLILARHGWPLVTAHERYREEDAHATA